MRYCKLNHVYFGDNAEVLHSFPSKCIDLIVTSPPYCDLRSYNGFTLNYPKLLLELYRVMKDGGVIVWVDGDQVIDGSEQLYPFQHAFMFKNAGFNVHDTMIYQKKNFTHPDAYRYHDVFEYMFIFSKGAPKTFNPIHDRLNETRNSSRIVSNKRRKDGSFYKRNVRKTISRYGKRHNIWVYKTGKNVDSTDPLAFRHPAVFPQLLAQDHILSWSNENDIILDPFAGSGTTLRMAKILNRKYIGIEISEEYKYIIDSRLQIADSIILERKTTTKLTDFF